MTQEFTGEEFKIEFCRAFVRWHESGEKGVNPEGNWECTDKNRHTWIGHGHIPTPSFGPDMNYRWKSEPAQSIDIKFRVEQEAESLSDSERDWYAGQALAGICAGTNWGLPSVNVAAEVAYRMADAMIVARKKS